MGSTENIQAQQNILRLIEKIIRKDLDVATGVWELFPYLCTLKLESKTEFNVFTAFRSITDHLPLPKQMPNWERSVYAQKANELNQIENEYREEIFSACRILSLFLRERIY